MPIADELRVSDQWRAISAIVDRYEEQVGPELPDIAPLLEGVPADNRVKVLAALLEVEQELRWKRRQGKTVEEYLEQYPELRSHGDVVLELARAECRLRCRAGGEKFRKEFASRFPDLDLECDTLAESTTSVDRQPTAGNCKTCPQVRPDRIGRYRVEARIGSGAFGVVYRCRHAELDRRVAIKIARDASGSADAFLHEAQNVAGLRHPSLVSLLDYGTADDGLPYIVYEYIAGRTLADRIAVGDYTLHDALRWTIAVAGALQAAHRQRIYHRDVKPGNILIDQEGNAHLTDFGLARRDETFYRNDRNVCLGTASYMSPEQAAFHADWAGPASDVYSLGVVFYELLCGRVPFRDARLEELMQQIRERQPVPPRSLNDGVPARVEEVCLRALAKDPSQRFRTAGDFAQALKAAVEPPHRRTALLVAVAALIALAAIGLWQLRGQPPLPAVAPPLAAPEALRAMEPRIDVVAGDGTLQELLPRHPLRSGDRLECFAQLNRPAYLYVVAFSSRGPARVLWPRSARLTNPAMDRFARCPAEGEGPLTTPSGGGVMAVLVAGREKPLDAASLRQLAAAPFQWPSPRRAGQFPATVFPPLPRAERPEYLVLRSADDAKLFDLPREFKPAVENLFNTYYAVMFPWLDATDGADPSIPKASAAAARRRATP
jgi:tRNA A-37 threonylcarbamoyl transferase component Bud32